MQKQMNQIFAVWRAESRGLKNQDSLRSTSFRSCPMENGR